MLSGLKLSDDVIKEDFTSTPDSRTLDFSPMRLGGSGDTVTAATAGDFTPRHINSLVRDIQPGVIASKGKEETKGFLPVGTT